MDRILANQDKQETQIGGVQTQIEGLITRQANLEAELATVSALMSAHASPWHAQSHACSFTSIVLHAT